MQALNNALQEPAITIEDAFATAADLNEAQDTERHGSRVLRGQFSIEAAQATMQRLHGPKFHILRIKRLTEKKAPKWLCKQTSGRFMVMIWTKGKTDEESSYHWVAVLADKGVIDGALKNPCKMQWLCKGKNISRIYEIRACNVLL